MRSFESDLEALRRQSLFRELRTVGGARGALVEIDGKSLVNFASNDYLGLSHHAVLREAFKRGVDVHGVGAGSSRLISGTRGPHRELEETMARFKGTEAALTFSTGYATALGTLGSILGKGDVVIVDKLAHACLIDAARLSGATLRVFPHNDLKALENRLHWAQRSLAEGDDGDGGRILVATESVFSMDGDRAPLEHIVALKDYFGALLLVDEAHAFGLIGKGGRGLADQCGVADDVDLHMGTFSKAAGVSGGYLCGSAALVDLLINRARSFIFSTAPPPAVAATAAEAVRLIGGDEGEARRKRAWSNARLFAEKLRVAGHEIAGEPESLIFPVPVGDEDEALALAARLREAGFFVPAIRYPTVARGAARLRVTISADHDAEQIEGLVKTLAAGGSE